MGYELPGEHLAFIASILGGSGYMANSFFRAYHTNKSLQFKIGSDDRKWHKGLARVTEEQLDSAGEIVRRFRIRGVVAGVGMPLLFMAYQAAKYQKKRPPQHTKSM
jgi:hypothetical protein